jgi:hypothetical protein
MFSNAPVARKFHGADASGIDSIQQRRTVGQNSEGRKHEASFSGAVTLRQ